MGKRAKVTRLVVFFGPGQLKLGERLVQVHPHHQEPFVIPETDVVARAVLLDQPSLQQDRLRLAPHHVRFQFRNALEQRPSLEIRHKSPGGMEILVHPPVQIPRLTHIDHPMEPVAEQVHPWPVRQIAQLLGQIGGNVFHGPKED